MTTHCLLVAFASTAILTLACPADAADVCHPALLQGAYGFQLSGNTAISGSQKPVASLGRLEFDGKGGVSGESSVNFAGYFLGNPITGNYEAHADCSITWKLQDTSGGWQHFAGVLTPDLLSVKFHQSDPGAAQNGTMQKAAPDCSVAGLAAKYSFSLSGNVIPMNPGDVAKNLSATGIAEPDAAGSVKLTVGTAQSVGTITIDSDCTVEMALTLPSGDSILLRGVLVSGGKRILAIATDPGTTVTATFTAK